MNEELLAASALLVQGAVRFANCNAACVWPAVRRLVLETVPYYANRSLQCKSAQAGRQVMSTTLAAPQRKL